MVGAGGSLAFKGVKIPYEVEHLYNPDFILRVPNKTIYIEAKGYFQDSSEAAKYRWVKEALDETEELVFVFEDPDKALHYLSKRKDGTKLSMSQWAEKNGFRWFTIETLKEIIP